LLREEISLMRQFLKSTAIRRFDDRWLFLTAALALVYALPPLAPPLKAEKTVEQKADAPAGPVEILRDFQLLPPEVDRIRRAILSAAMTGQIEALRVPVEMNEIPPIFAKDKVGDPVAYWKKVSADGNGREILAVLIQLFRTGYVRKATTGGELYIWPYFAEMPLDKLTAAQEVELLTLVPPSRYKTMKASGRYDHYRIGIAANGTWHFFHDHAD
jgi:hypothetical protein